MSKFIGEKRYADILTILLVIVIIGILVLLGYFGYKAIKKNVIESNAQDAVQEFYNNVSTHSDSDDEDEEAAPPMNIEDFNTTVPETNTSSSERKRTYLDGYEIKGVIKIPKTGVEYPILEKVTVGSLSKSVAILDIRACSEITTKVTELNVLGTNALILGHNLRDGKFFARNDELELGDQIKITDYMGEEVTYKIYKMYYTTPEDVSFMERDLDPNSREITLQTCNNDSSQRLIIWAKDN